MVDTLCWRRWVDFELFEPKVFSFFFDTLLFSCSLNQDRGWFGTCRWKIASLPLWYSCVIASGIVLIYSRAMRCQLFQRTNDFAFVLQLFYFLKLFGCRILVKVVPVYGTSQSLVICRPFTWPVLKHGPRSVTCLRVNGSYETQRRSESKGLLLVGWGEIFDPSGLRRITGSSQLLGRSKSKHVVTRKMVNYACVGWSQRKLWWRAEAVLTCKSIAWHEHRGERLIEPSSSWFPSKFPSG